MDAARTAQRRIMINFAFCDKDDRELEFMKEETVRCFAQRGVDIAVMCYHNAHELQRCLSCNCPDILFYDIESDDGQMRKAALAAKKENKRMISVITEKRRYVPQIEDVLLEPVYVMPDRNRRHLWACAALAYETALDDADSFSYYVRPEYVHVRVDDIQYFASEGRRTHIISSDLHDTFYQKLDVVEKIIRQKNGQFLRIHKSYLVNARYISGYNREHVVLTTGEKLRISRYEYYKEVNERFRHTKVRRCPQY